MSWFSKVAWKEGLFMQPQHLQQADRYVENLVNARTRLLTPYPWGVSDLTVDRDACQQGRISLRAISGVMPDGTPFDAPGTGPLPVPVTVPDDAAGQFVWLTLPDSSPNMRDMAPYQEEGSSTRWGILTEAVADTAAASRNEQVLELAVPRLELVIRKTPRPGYQNLRLARVSEVRDGVVTLDETFPPPSLVIGAHALHDAFAIILWRDAGIGAGTAGLLWSGSVAAEVLVFLLAGPPLLARIGLPAGIAVAACAGALRWAVLASTTAIPLLAAAEALHGLSFALLHLACLGVIEATAPPELRATALALYGTVALGLSGVLATLASGALYGAFGASAFWAMAALSLAALPLVPGLRDR